MVAIEVCCKKARFTGYMECPDNCPSVKELEARINELEEKCKDYAGTLHSRDMRIKELEAEVATLTKYNESMKDNIMEVQDKACIGHIEEVESLKAEVDALLQGHAGDKGTVRIIWLENMRLKQNLKLAEDALELVANNATPHNSCVLVCREALTQIRNVKDHFNGEE